MKKEFQNLDDFYCYYLTEHQNFTSRTLHFLGTILFVIAFIYALIFGPWWLAVVAPVFAYSFAWVGHFFFERNKPATFQYPWYSLLSDFKMTWDILTFQIGRKMGNSITTLETKEE
ncbi:MAG: Mpo1-like protein [Saprospiraceae bacterium]